MNEVIFRLAGLGVFVMLVASLYGSAFGIGGEWHSDFWAYMKGGTFLLIFGGLWVYLQVKDNG